MITHLVQAAQPAVDPQIAAYIQPVVATIVTALVGILVLSMKRGVELGFKYLEQKIGIDNAKSVESEALKLVRYFEQSPAFKEMTNENKKNMAVIALTRYCQEKNLPFDHSFFDKTIEAAVHVVKVEASPLFDSDVELESWTGVGTNDVPTSDQGK